MKKLLIPLCILVLLLAALLIARGGLVPAQDELGPSDAAASPAPAPAALPATEAPTERPLPAGAVVVTDIDGLLGALASDTTIVIDASHLRLDDASDYGFGYSDGPYTWVSMGNSEYQLMLRELEGLTICGRGLGETTISTNALWADVLMLQDCADVTLEGLTFGHRGVIEGGCQGDVLRLSGCGEICIRNCELFGCGVIGVNAVGCSRMTLEDCLLRDCSMSALNITECLDFQARDCEILRCGKESPLAVLCVASCDGFALINCTVRECGNAALVDAMNSTSVCLLGCEAAGNRFSNALFQLYDYNLTVSGSALSDNEFGACYYGGAQVAETGAGTALLTFSDFARMEHKPFEGDYTGPIWGPAVTPAAVLPPVAVPPPGETQEVHVTTVDELLAAIAPRTTVYLDGEEFDVSSASNYAGAVGTYYGWAKEYDGYTLVLKDLEDFALVGGGIGVTLVSAEPRYADVLRFENCQRIAVSDLTMGHTIEPGFCTGDVLAISWCENVTVERCGFFGCGEVGINAECSAAIRVNDSNIYDCSYLGVQLDRVSDMSFTGCSITGCGGGGDWGCNGASLSDCSEIFYNGERLFNGRIELNDAA